MNLNQIKILGQKEKQKEGKKKDSQKVAEQKKNKKKQSWTPIA